MKDKYYIIMIFGLIILLFYNQKCIKENMTNTETNDQKLIKAIKQKYSLNVEGIRNLEEVAKKFQTNGLTIAGDITVIGKIKTNNWTINTETLNTLSINFETNNSILQIKNDTLLNINGIHPGMIVAYYPLQTNITAPSGWAICDGKSPTPDLRGQFIYGANANTSLGVSGGSEIIYIENDMIPSHTHKIEYTESANHGYLLNPLAGGMRIPNLTTGGCGGDIQFLKAESDGIPFSIGNMINTNNIFTNAEKSEPVNILPPYFVLIYIMKL
jgi:hypothetical protein